LILYNNDQTDRYGDFQIFQPMAHTNTHTTPSISPLPYPHSNTYEIETYSGTPADIERALNNITVTLGSLAESGNAHLNITLYDGDGIGCIGNKYLRPGSVRKGCYIRSTTIKVVIKEDLTPTKAESVSGAASSPFFLTFKEYVIGSAVCAVIFLACARCWYVRSRRRKLERYDTAPHCTLHHSDVCCPLSLFPCNTFFP
jgi:hypothetical protein